MTLAVVTKLTDGVYATGADQSSYTTDETVSFAADELALVFVSPTEFGGNPSAPTLSGGGMTTWTRMTALDTQYAGSGSHDAALFVFRAQQASPGAAAALTVSFGGDNHTSIQIHCMGITGATAGSNGADAILQEINNTGNDGTSTLDFAALGSTDNMVVAGHGVRDSTPNFTGSSGYTQYGLVEGGGSPGNSTLTEYDINGADPSVTHDSNFWGSAGVEVEDAGGGVTHALAGSAAGSGAASGALRLTLALAGAAAGAGAAAADLKVTLQLAGSAAGAGSASGFLRKPLVAAIAGPPLPQLARVSVHDNAFRKVGELRTASAVERSYELGAPGLASLTISRDDPLIAATRPGAGNVIAIESPDYPFPWVGAIDRRQGSDAAGISLQARGFAAILGDRFLPSTFQTELTAADEIVRVLEIVNNRNNTAIRPGRVQDSGASIPDLVFPNTRASAAMDAIAEAGGIEYWVDYEVEPSNILPLLQIQASRGFDRFRTVVLEDGFNATFDEWIEDGGAAAFALTVIAGQTTVTESFTERSRATKIVEEAGGFVTQFVPIGPTPSGEIVDVGGGVKRKDSGISFPHGFARFAEVIVESPATRREVTVIREELRSRDITVQTADSLLRVRPIPERVLAGAAIRKSDWRVLEVGDVVRVVAPNSFVTGFDGPARIIGTQPDEANGRMGLVVELLREVA